MDVPETRFTRVGDDRVAYQVFGEGPPDLVYMAGTSETIDVRWEWPPYTQFEPRGEWRSEVSPANGPCSQFATEPEREE